jgi:sigma-B regulation protein RsbU (phosphoserine phosphatase)
MQPPILDQIRTSLLERRATLNGWLGRTSPSVRAEELGPIKESAVQAHIASLDGHIADAEAGRLGLCTVCHDYVNPSRLVADYTANVCLDHLSAEEASGLERELELAQVVQRALLPAEPPDIPGLQMAAFTRPAQIIGGDYFDFLPFQTGASGWVIGDVAGHGVSASLHMAGVQALCRAVIPAASGPSQAAERIQRLFIHNSRYTTFVSLFLAAYDPRTRALTYCNAGHNPPLWLARSERDPAAPRWLRATGAAVGLVETGLFGEETIELARGDLLVLYTDGVVEAENATGEAFGRDRLLEVAAASGPADAAAVLTSLTQALEGFIGARDPEDDVTILVARVA